MFDEAYFFLKTCC